MYIIHILEIHKTFCPNKICRTINKPIFISKISHLVEVHNGQRIIHAAMVQIGESNNNNSILIGQHSGNFINILFLLYNSCSNNRL